MPDDLTLSQDIPDELRVLLVEDNPGDAELVREHLADVPEAAPRLEVASSLSDADGRLADESFDAALLDLNLPDSEGLDTVERFRERSPDVPVVVLTGTGGDEVGIAALRRGALDFLPKDEITGRMLLRSIRFAVERQRRRRGESRFRALIENSRDLVTILKSDFSIRYVSPSLSRILGFEPEEKMREDATLELHPDDRKRVLEEGRRALEDPSHQPRLQYRVRHRDGSWRVLDTIVQNRMDDPAIGGLILNSWDITDLRETEEQLRKARRRLEILQHVSSTANEAKSVHEAFESLVAYLPDAIGWDVCHAHLREGDELRPLDVWNPDEEDRFEAFRRVSMELTFGAGEGLVGAAMSSGRAEWMTGLSANEAFVRREVAGALERGLVIPVVADGEVRAVVELFSTRDEEVGEELLEVAREIGSQLGRVAERERALKKLEERERRFRALVENASDLISMLDRQGRMKYQSPPVKRLLGYEPHELEGRSVFDFIHPEDLRDARAAWDALLDDSGGTVHVPEFRFRHKDGSWRVWEATLTNLLDDRAVEAVLSNGRDITERQELEKQLRRAQKMEAVGRLSGGIAHDFNNLLTVIRGHADFVLIDEPGPGPWSEATRSIRDAADQAAELINQLLAFSEDQILRPRAVDLNERIEGLRRLTDRVLGEDVRVVLHLDEEIPPIRVDPGQLEQVLLNLAVNARDAMPEGGTLSFSTAEEEVDADRARETAELEPGRYVRLAISDTGVGIEEDVQAKIFEPFFTTKGRERGTGLGLAMVYGILAQSGGAIEVESTPGEGTTFVLHFPVADDEPETTQTVDVSVLETSAVTGRILLVEDDARVRRVTRLLLERAGFDVEAVAGAERGLELLENGSDDFEVLLTDLVLPGMGGRELLERVGARAPDLALVAMSGYAEGSPGRRGDLPKEIHFIQKPFSPEELVQVVREALMEGRGAAGES